MVSEFSFGHLKVHCEVLWPCAALWSNGFTSGSTFCFYRAQGHSCTHAMQYSNTVLQSFSCHFSKCSNGNEEYIIQRKKQNKQKTKQLCKYLWGREPQDTWVLQKNSKWKWDWQEKLHHLKVNKQGWLHISIVVSQTIVSFLIPTEMHSNYLRLTYKVIYK